MTIFALHTTCATHLETAIKNRNIDHVQEFLQNNTVPAHDKARYLDLCEHAIKDADEDFLIYRMKNGYHVDSELLFVGGFSFATLLGILTLTQEAKGYRTWLSLGALVSLGACIKGHQLANKYRTEDCKAFQKNRDQCLAIKQLIYQS